MRRFLLTVIIMVATMAMMSIGAMACPEKLKVNGIKGGLQIQREREEAAALAAIQAEVNPNQQPTPGKPGEQPKPATPAKVVSAPAGMLFIGDSRCVQMQEAVGGGGASWIAKNGGRYEWFSETAVPQADGIVGKGTKVIICMGVNDPGNIGNYAALVNQKAAEWSARGARIYYVSVNPVWENPYTSEQQVLNFNASMPGMLSGVRWIDTYNYIQAAGCRIVDGLHYDAETYVKIFNAIVGSL